MTIAEILNKSVRTVKHNSPEILTGFSIAGVVGTGYLAFRAGMKSARAIDEIPDMSDDWKVNLKENAKLTWKFYIPPTISGALSISAIIGASKASGRRTTAAVAAYSITQKAFDEYKEHVIEQLGKGKEQKIRDELAQKKVSESPPENSKVLIISGGDVLCCELWSGRYFRSDMETLRRAENEINARVVQGYYASLDELYDELGLPHTSDSSRLGWNSDKLLEMQFSTVLSPENEPCLAFEYNYIRPLDGERLL